jgi:hypothetical protein
MQYSTQKTVNRMMKEKSEIISGRCTHTASVFREQILHIHDVKEEQEQ